MSLTKRHGMYKMCVIRKSGRSVFRDMMDLTANEFLVENLPFPFSLRSSCVGWFVS